MSNFDKTLYSLIKYIVNIYILMCQCVHGYYNWPGFIFFLMIMVDSFLSFYLIFALVVSCQLQYSRVNVLLIS